MSTTTSSTSNNVRIVSYNLLSSKLARPSHFTHANPDHLEADYRLPLILEKLDEAMNRGFGGEEESAPPTIFALQEVCYPFASELHTFFAQRGYHFVTGLYGRPFNGYMGVGIAYPLKDFETVNVDICRLSDERAGGWPREKIDKDESKDALGQIFSRITKKVGAIASQTMKTINNRIIKRLGYDVKKVIDPWDMSKNRFNVLLTATLRYRAGECSTFSISNYHMPCAFFAPAVMNIHTEMVSKRVQDLAVESWKSIQSDKCPEEADGETKTIPYILAGDFNIMPDSPHYKLVTTGKLDKSDPTYPPAKHGEEWKIEALPMDSAYAASSVEPEFTNYAHCRDDDPFIGTLDYIFLSQKERTSNCDGGNETGEWWKVHGVQKLPCKEDSGGPFPNEKEPSDHYLISADLELTNSKI
eukprot:CAMPEP_0172315578 /NCGR_PEP_ID=MMETSP1058-20130122/25597_1 /TAXON_ID=83371 /ORGANISM="Detonula confervacea, Strain CCMP 353" /LENGTH=414 /DNA_ID=CAMNT_0013029673 /DNA_START=133 /DNA_END=1377 /DNA_ORIENTATION=+